MLSTRKPGEVVELWVFKEEELQDPSLYEGTDEFIAKPEGYDQGIVIQRNGLATNRWEDGKKGIKKKDRRAAESEEVLYEKPSGEAGEADTWKSVVTDKTDRFIRFASETDEMPIIKAETHDDNHDYEVTFDALPWFEQATDEEILALAAIEWGGDQEADQVAIFMEDLDENVATMFNHKKNCGFECNVDEESAMAWLKEYRPHLYEKIGADE